MHIQIVFERLISFQTNSPQAKSSLYIDNKTQKHQLGPAVIREGSDDSQIKLNIIVDISGTSRSSHRRNFSSTLEINVK